jgi:hypothetical protein
MMTALSAEAGPDRTQRLPSLRQREMLTMFANAYAGRIRREAVRHSGTGQLPFSIRA